MHKEAELDQLVTKNKLGKSVHVYKLHNLAELILTRWNGQQFICNKCTSCNWKTLMGWTSWAILCIRFPKSFQGI